MDSLIHKFLIKKTLRNNLLFGDVFQRLDDEVPEGLHALDKQGFVGGVWVDQSRAKAHHVPVRVLRTEDPAFQTGMDDHDFGFLAELLLVDLLHQVEDGRVDVGFPAGIVASGVGLGTIVGKVLTDLLSEFVLVGIDEAAG